MMDPKNFREIWKQARSSRAKTLELYAEDLAGWIAERVGEDIVEHGQQGGLTIAFLEANRKSVLRNLYCPQVLRFDCNTQEFVTPCGSQFSQEEMFSLVSERLHKSEIEALLEMHRDSLVVQYSINETTLGKLRDLKNGGLKLLTKGGE